jgi:hypothetical protein
MNPPSPLRGCVAIGENVVIPAKAGIQVFELVFFFNGLEPASVGMTNYDTASFSRGRGNWEIVSMKY